MMTKAIYIGVFLDEASRTALLRAFPPEHEVVYADHVTLRFSPSSDELTSYVFGQRIYMKVIGHVFDARAQAVLVELNNDIPHKSNPHITISTSPSTKPAYSNVLLADSDNVDFVHSDMIISGMIDIYPRKHVIKL